MNIALEAVREHFPDARNEVDGSLTFECPACRLEGRTGKRVKVFTNGSIACARFAGMSEANREHVRPIREALELAETRANVLIEEVTGGLTLEAEDAGRGKARVSARNGSGLLHVDAFPLDVAAKRADFLKRLPAEKRADAETGLLRLAERFNASRKAEEEEGGDDVRRECFAELPDGRLIEQLTGERFAVFEPATGEVGFALSVECDGVTYRPQAGTEIIRFADGVAEYGDDLKLDAEIEAFTHRHVDLPERDRRLAARYIRLSFAADRLAELPYLRFIGPRGNGKSRALSVVGGACYRALSLVSPSAASIFRLCDRYKPTLILDEMNLPEGGDDTAAVFQILNTGFQRGARIPRCEPTADGDFQVRTFDPFGAKVLAGLKTTDSQAFESRCVRIEMTKTNRTDIRIRLSESLLREQEELRRKLTLWRLRNWRRDFDALLDAAEDELRANGRIEPRYVQIATPLFALISDAGLRADFARMLESRTEADAQERTQSFDGQLVAVIHGLLFDLDEAGNVIFHREDGIPEPTEGQPCDLLPVFRIAEAVNADLPDKRRHDERWIGKQVRKLGFRTVEISRRRSPMWKKSAVVFERDRLLKLFLSFSLPVPADFHPVTSGQSDNPSLFNDLSRPDNNSGNDFKEATSGQVKYNSDNDLEEVTGLTGCNSPEAEEKEMEAFPVSSPHFVALDTETEPFDKKRGITPGNARMIGLSICYDGDRAEYETEATAWPFLLPEPDETVVFHNAKFDFGVLERAGLPTPPKWEDTMIAAHLLDENGPHGLKPLAKAELGIEEPLTFEEADRMRLLDPEVFAEYARNDARFTWRLWQRFGPELDRQDLRRVYELEKRLVPIVRRMEKRGMRVDLVRLARLRDEVDALTKTTEAEIFELCGCRFDLHSPEKVGAILFDRLSVPSGKTTGTGQRSVDRDTLEDVRGYHPAVDAMLRFRELDKLASTFIHTLPRLADAAGRVHPEFQSLGAKTGRFSCKEPNVQQIPARSELGKRLRSAFIADDGNALVVADYSQMELRILAHYSQDAGLLEAYRAEGIDLHTRTASRMFRKPESDIGKEERAVAKMMNFGIAYGITAEGLFNSLKPSGVDVTPEQCEGFIRDYFRAYPGIKRFLDKAARTVRERGFVFNLYGRRRRVSGKTGREIRQAQNFIIQATAADMAKLAMVSLADRLPEGAEIIAQIHDEIIVECRAEDAEAVRVAMIEEMTRTPEGFTVPMLVEVGIGANWMEAK